MTAPKQVTREQMARLLDERCPTMSPASREACLSGTVLELADGTSYQAPAVPDDGKPTHTTTGLIGRKDSHGWNN